MQAQRQLQSLHSVLNLKVHSELSQDGPTFRVLHWTGVRMCTVVSNGTGSVIERWLNLKGVRLRSFCASRQSLKGLTAEDCLLTTFHDEARSPSWKSHVGNAQQVYLTLQQSNRLPLLPTKRTWLLSLTEFLRAYIKAIWIDKKLDTDKHQDCCVPFEKRRQVWDGGQRSRKSYR